MGIYKQTTETIEDWFNSNASTNQVTKGDISEVDISSQTVFPLAHIIYGTVEHFENHSEYNYQILVLDKFVAHETTKLDVLDGTNEIMQEFMRSLYNGSLFSNRVRVETSQTAEVMYDQLQNRLYGWSLDLTVVAPREIRC